MSSGVWIKMAGVTGVEGCMGVTCECDGYGSLYIAVPRYAQVGTLDATLYI